MAIEIIDTLSQKNNGIFPLVDSNDIKGGFYQVDSIEERDLIPSVRRKEGMFCAVKNDKLYQLISGIDNENWTVFNSGDSGIDEGYIDSILNDRLNNISASSIHIIDEAGNYEGSNIEECLKEISDTLNKKIDNIVFTDDNILNFYANEVLIKSVKIEGVSQGDSQIGSEEIEDLKNTKFDDITVNTQDGITNINLFANGSLLKTIEIKTSGDSLIHVGADEPTADNCEVWIDVSDDEEFSSNIEDSLVNEIKSIISTLQNEINSLKRKIVEQEAKIVEHEDRIEYLELNGGGSSGGSGSEDNDGSNNITTKFIPLAFEGGEVLILEDNTILTLEDINY